MIVFTICANNFLGYALALRASLWTHHPEATFYAALCDEPDAAITNALDFETITLAELGIPRLADMRSRYNITELNTSIKPFVFTYLFDRHPGEVITYLDPDILVTSRLVELEQGLGSGANCVLTPHILEPAEFAEMDDRQFLRYGVFNLGFCALRDTPEVRRVVSWWGRRLETQCVIDLENGIFVDQKWADLLPGFIADTLILRHPGYNVAYWNLSHRRVRLEASGWTSNGSPLRFFHFSGNKIEDESVFSRHSWHFRAENIGDLKLLLDEYRQNVFSHGYHHYATIPYAFSWGGLRAENMHTPASEAVGKALHHPVAPYLPMLRATSLSEFTAARHSLRNVVAKRVAVECASIPFDEESFTLRGYCFCCKREADFQVSGMYSSRRLPDGRVVPNWREHLNCLACGLVNRVRAALQILQQLRAPAEESSIYITERKTTTHDWLAQQYKNVQGSEYFPGDHQPGEMIDGVRHEDVQDLSFGDESFDYILTFDVLEHVPFPQRAFNEFVRCLKPGGMLIMTVPFSVDAAQHHVRAILDEQGQVVHLMEPEYHGNPLDMENGSLCYRYFGWQVVEDLRTAGFEQVEVLNYWSEQLCHFGDPQTLIVAVRSDTIVS